MQPADFEKESTIQKKIALFDSVQFLRFLAYLAASFRHFTQNKFPQNELTEYSSI